MIGQVQTQQQLRKSTAKSVLITGPKHWGKKTLLREIFKQEESVFEITGEAAVFRESLERVYETVRPTRYLIPDVDQTNATIQNLLLKVIEEPPHDATFYLTAAGSILPTITSRCVTYRMQPYSEADLAHLTVPVPLIGIAKSPGECELLSGPGVSDIGLALSELHSMFDNSTLAKIMKTVKDLNWKIKENGVSQDIFILLVSAVFGESRSLDWLRAQPQDGVAYARMQYFMNLWAERQVMA